MSCPGLSEEQRKRIDENRKKALALKARKTFSHTVHSGCSNSGTFCSAKNESYSTKKNDGLGQSHKAFLPSCSSSFSKSIPTNGSNSVGVGYTNPPKSRLGEFTAQRPTAVVSKEKFYGLPDKVVRGKCVLISQDRFCVEAGYHSSLIEYFKQMESRSYDTASKLWSFHLKEYDKFLKGARNFQPEIVIESLPPVIVQAFCGKKCDNSPEEVSLSNIDEKLTKTLMPFQKESVRFALQHGGRVLLADGMGLGKTLQALSIAKHYRSEWPLLIITPSSVRYDWAQQIYKWLPSVDPQEVNVIDTGKDSVGQGLVNIISYDLMPKRIQKLKDKHFKIVIMDESHFLKNAKAIRTKAAVVICKSAKRVILLSGTPALSRPSELFTQISTVCPNIFKFHDFGLRYCGAKQLPWGWDYSGASNLEELQLLLEKKVMIRRQKSDVLQQLPDKTRQVVILNPVLVSFDKRLNQACKVMNKASLKGSERRGALLQYFHETCKAKLRAVKDFILDLIESDKKFLIFAHHQEMLDCLEDAIIERGNVKHIRIDGSTKSEHRSHLCKKFQIEDDCKVAVLSIMAANAGLNLSAANLVVFAELFWNPGILVQAEDRVHRIGQKNAVLIQYLVARNTADDFIWPLVQDKITVLIKAGLSKDCFSDADTKHVMAWFVVKCFLLTVKSHYLIFKGFSFPMHSPFQHGLLLHWMSTILLAFGTPNFDLPDGARSPDAKDKAQSNIMEMFKQSFLEESLPSSSNSDKEPENMSKDYCVLSPVKRKHPRSPNSSPSSKKMNVTQSPESPSKRQLRITKYIKTSEKDSSQSQNISQTDYTATVAVKKISVTKEKDSDESSVDVHGMNGFKDSKNVLLPRDGTSKSQSENKVRSDALSMEDFEVLENSNWDEEF